MCNYLGTAGPRSSRPPSFPHFEEGGAGNKVSSSSSSFSFCTHTHTHTHMDTLVVMLYYGEEEDMRCFCMCVVWAEYSRTLIFTVGLVDSIKVDHDRIYIIKLPNQQRWYAKWKLSWNIYTSHTCFLHVWRWFVCSVGAYEQNFCLGAQSEVY